MSKIIKARLGVLCCLLLLAGTAVAQANTACDICGETIHGQYRWIVDQATGKTNNICLTCSGLEARCYLCGLPMRGQIQTLPDGRLICERDAKTVVESDDDAKRICQDVPGDLDRLLSRYMTFPDTNVILSMGNKFYLENLFRAPGQSETSSSVNGATTSNPLAGNRVVHSICLLDHLPKARLMAVCAHEYTHAWMGQNVSPGRSRAIDRDTVEAFCELVAYKYMESRGETEEMNKISKLNGYTRGKINVLIAADTAYGFGAVVEWIEGGEDTTLEMATLERVRAVNGAYVAAAPAPTAAALLYYPAATRPEVGPSTLVLKGISGTGTHRFALINDATFEPMEKGRVRLGQTNVVVRCLEIHDDSVTIQVDGSAEKKQLFLKSAQ